MFSLSSQARGAATTSIGQSRPLGKAEGVWVPGPEGAQCLSQALGAGGKGVMDILPSCIAQETGPIQLHGEMGRGPWGTSPTWPRVEAPRGENPTITGESVNLKDQGSVRRE